MTVLGEGYFHWLSDASRAYQSHQTIRHSWEDIPGKTQTRGRAVPSERALLCPTITQISAIVLSARTNSSPMSHSHLAAASSTNFQLIINDALKAYETRTKKELLSHPLASQLEACNSPAAILTVLEQQVQGPDQSRNCDDRWTKWLGPTVNVLCTLSDTLGEGVGLVSFPTRACPRFTLLHIHGRYSH